MKPTENRGEPQVLTWRLPTSHRENSMGADGRKRDQFISAFNRLKLES